MHHYRILDVSAESVAISISELTGADRTGYSEMRTLKIVNLQTGEVKNLAQARNVNGENIGWDWHFAPL
jgi:hypothetical protein